jgi:hypothetical protein
LEGFMRGRRDITGVGERGNQWRRESKGGTVRGGEKTVKRVGE